MELRRFDQWDRHVPGFVVVAIALMAPGLPAEAQEPGAPTGPRAGAGGVQALHPGVFASAGSSRKAEAWTGGLNWYLTRKVRNTINVERTVFDEDPDGPRPAENAVAFRTQVSF